LHYVCADAIEKCVRNDNMTLSNAKLPLVRLGDGGTYEGEWLTGTKLRER
jgi:hypothetical protein